MKFLLWVILIGFAMTGLNLLWDIGKKLGKGR